MVKSNNIALIVYVAFWLLSFFAFIFVMVWQFSTPSLLPERTLHLPAPEQIGGLSRGDEGIVYAKEPLLFEQTGIYVVRGYLKASRPLSGAISVYMRESDPASDPACKALAVPSQAQSGVLEQTVYACKRGREDVKIGVAEFANANLASFCSSDLRGREVRPPRARWEWEWELDRRWSDPSDIVAVPKPWIGVEWNPLLPHPLALVFKDLTAVRVFRFPLIARHPCASFR
jgi:hypothetical protein